MSRIPASSIEISQVDRICILVLSLEWIMFGSCHFVFRKLTELELPDLPFKSAAVIITGMVEVATGVLILFPKTRKLASGISIALLLAFLFPIFYMLMYDSALPGTELWRNSVRVLLVPNHILLALCALNLFFSQSWPAGPAGILEGAFAPKLLPATRQGSLIVACVMLFANAAGFLVILCSAWNQPTARMWAMMCLAAGAAAGFLFGVPRVNPGLVSQDGLRPNSNIEVISDWITKIIVGVGLVEFRKIATAIDGISTQLGVSLITNPLVQKEANAISFAKALIVYFAFAGAIQGYLLTRLYLTREFQEEIAVVPKDEPEVDIRDSPKP